MAGPMEEGAPAAISIEQERTMIFVQRLKRNWSDAKAEHEDAAAKAEVSKQGVEYGLHRIEQLTVQDEHHRMLYTYYPTTPNLDNMQRCQAELAFQRRLLGLANMTLERATARVEKAVKALELATNRERDHIGYMLVEIRIQRQMRDHNILIDAANDQINNFRSALDRATELLAEHTANYDLEPNDWNYSVFEVAVAAWSRAYNDMNRHTNSTFAQNSQLATKARELEEALKRATRRRVWAEEKWE